MKHSDYFGQVFDYHQTNDVHDPAQKYQRTMTTPRADWLL